jgi:hypothetical protein
VSLLDHPRSRRNSYHLSVAPLRAAKDSINHHNGHDDVANSVAAACVRRAAAEIKSIGERVGRITIVIAGKINPGDTDAFAAELKHANQAGKSVANVNLDSLGGNLLEGVKLAGAVRVGKLSTNVEKTCASACFLVFAAGNTKSANYTAQIGVHGASDISGAETVRTQADR